MFVLIWLDNTNKGGDTMFDYWVTEVIAERVYKVNEVYFDAGDVMPSVVTPDYNCLKSNNVARIHSTAICFSELPAFAVAKLENIYLIKKYYHGKVQDIRELYLGKYKN